MREVSGIKIIICVVFIVLWGYMYYRLKRNKIYTFAFVLGSIGFFTLNILFFRDILEGIIIFVLMKIISVFKLFFYDLDVFYLNSTIIVKVDQIVKAIELNYECSGLIESVVFSSIILFYPIKSKFHKFKKFIFGNIIILGANTLRIMMIIASLKLFGVNTFEVVHLFVGRYVFYIIIILLYYNLLTKYHIYQYKEV